MDLECEFTFSQVESTTNEDALFAVVFFAIYKQPKKTENIIRMQAKETILLYTIDTRHNASRVQTDEVR